jgi:hypothetical protein
MRLCLERPPIRGSAEDKTSQVRFDLSLSDLGPEAQKIVSSAGLSPLTANANPNANPNASVRSQTPNHSWQQTLNPKRPPE